MKSIITKPAMQQSITGKFARIAKLIRSRLYFKETLLFFEHGTLVRQASPAKITYITAENVGDVLQFQHQKKKIEFEEFLRLGDTGYFAYLDGKCVHRTWVVHTPRRVEPHPLMPRQLRKNEVYIHYCETAPAARGLNIFPAVLSRISEEFKKEGVSLIIAVNAKNGSSIRAIRKTGFKEKERDQIIILFGIKLRRHF